MPFHVRPLHVGDVLLMTQPIWFPPHIGLNHMYHTIGIGAITPEGALVGYCGFRYNARIEETKIEVIQSRQRGAGHALLAALKARSMRIVAKNVLYDAVPWWERQGFRWCETSPPDEDDAGDYDWFCEEEMPFVPMEWHQRPKMFDVFQCYEDLKKHELL